MTTKKLNYWFLIRGLMRESVHWEDFPAKFEAAFPGHRAITLDLPGVGEQWNVKSPLTVSEIAHSIREQAKKIVERMSQPSGSQPACYLLAISLGGMVALDWIQKFPGEIQGGVFINTSLSGINPFYKRLKPRAWIPLFEIVLTSNVRNRERKVLQLTTSQYPIQDSSLTERMIAYRKHPATKTNFLRQLIAASRFSPMPKKIKTPVLLLNSAGDRLVDSSCSIQIQAKWNWELKTHPSANHDLPLEDPDWVIAQIRDWLNRQKSD
jgi:pimeloyl-ACP methyl ester carboxylesterase